MPEILLESDRPILRIGAVAEILHVHARTLRLYEERGLVAPARKRGQRQYSRNDVVWLNCLRQLLHEDGYSLNAIPKLLEFVPCWELRGCPREVYQSCTAARERRLECWEVLERVCRNGRGVCSECPIAASVREEAPEQVGSGVEEGRGTG
ncbi:MerR family transcriptional regulator [bacterium]|nr:MerR family transcriptional regulator [bacterium]